MEQIVLGMPSGQLIIWLVIAVAIGIIFVLLLRYFSNKKRKKTEQSAAAKEEEEDLKRGYRFDFNSFTSKKKRLISLKNQKIIIVTEEKEKYEFIFSVSRPLFDSGILMLNFNTKINGVTDAKKLNNYQCLIKISPAAESNEVYQRISQLLFRALESRYSWMSQKVAIKLHPLSDSKLLIAIPGFYISDSSDHNSLLFMLNSIVSEKEVFSEKGEIILYAKHFGKEDSEKVKDILREHFIGGVEFIYDGTE